MNIEQWSVNKIKPYENNPRLNEKAVEQVAASIKELGFRQPIVVDENGVIVVGHTRWKAAKLLKLKTAPVHVAKDLTPEKAWVEIETCERRDDEIAVLERLFQAGWLHGYAKGMHDASRSLRKFPAPPQEGE